MHRILLVVVMTFAHAAWGAPSPGQKCEAGKNQEAGKYAACVSKAGAKQLQTAGSCSLTTALACYGDGDCPTGETCAKDPTKYNDTLAKCATKFSGKWDSLTEKAGGACPDGLDATEIQGAVDAHVANVAAGLAGEGLSDCAADLSTCESDLSSCETDLGTAEADLGTCEGNLTTCSTDLATAEAARATCEGDLATAQSDLTTCNGSLGTCTTSLANCTGDLGTCTTDLATCTGDLGSCTSDLGTAQAGTAVAGEVLAGRTFSSAAGLGVSGTMPNNGAVAITPGTTSQTIAAGYHDGAGTVAGDADLVASNILSGVNLFGVTGTALPAQLLKTGQTQCWNAAGTVISCTETGQDGELQKGLTASFTDNGDGTISDLRTGLMWERLNDAGGINDRDATFTWTNAFNKVKVLNGNATGCIAAGNPSSCCTGAGTGSCTAFAGHNDWRLPNRFELESLLNLGTTLPTTHTLFKSSCTASCVTCSCTQSHYYWSASTYGPTPNLAWIVDFTDGDAFANSKTGNFYVRAVRGAS